MAFSINHFFLPLYDIVYADPGRSSLHIYCVQKKAGGVQSLTKFYNIFLAVNLNDIFRVLFIQKVDPSLILESYFAVILVFVSVHPPKALASI